MNLIIDTFFKGDILDPEACQILNVLHSARLRVLAVFLDERNKFFTAIRSSKVVLDGLEHMTLLLQPPKGLDY